MDNIFFILSKIVFTFFKPSNIYFILFTIFTIFTIVNNKKIYKYLLFILLIFIFFINIFQLGNRLLYIIENRFTTLEKFPDDIKGIIVLGGSEIPILTQMHNKVHLNGSSERLIETIKLATIYKNSKIIFLGGGGYLAKNELTEADVAKKFFVDMNLDINRVIFVSKPRNTYESIKELTNIIDKNNSKHYVLITSARHMPRTIGVARKFNFNFVANPVDYNTITNNSILDRFQGFTIFSGLLSLDSAFKEYLGLLAYWLTGKIETLFPKEKI